VQKFYSDAGCCLGRVCWRETVLKPFKLAGQGLALCVLVFCLGQQAQAAYDYTILGDGGLVGGFNVQLDGASHNGILVGGLHVRALPGAGVPGYADFTSVCVDLNGSVYIGSTYKFDKVPFAGQTGLNPSWGNPLVSPPNASTASQAINNAADLYATIHPTTDTGWAMLQLAIWKAIYDTDSAGNIIVDPTMSRFNVAYDPTGAWNVVLAGLSSFHRSTDYAGYLLSPEDQRAQELLIGTTPVPEPATILGGILLLIPMGVSAMRYVRNKRSA
jgi:hypothetical protein